MDFTGRPMRPMVYVAAEGIVGDRALKQWIGHAVEYVRGLPPKTLCRDGGLEAGAPAAHHSERGAAADGFDRRERPRPPPARTGTAIGVELSRSDVDR